MKLRKPHIILIVFTLVSSALIFLCFTPNKQENDKQYHESFAAHNRVQAVALPDKFDFAGESVPMDTYYVRESLDREILVNTYWHSNTMLMMKRAARYFPVIEPILKKNGIPDDFKYLALIESSFTNVVSPSNASGFWQFLDKTARQYGLTVNEEVDERYHVEKSTGAACRYLLSSYSAYNNWTLAAASYNAGPGRISKELTRQKTNSYYDLYLNAETTRYIFRILAMKLIIENPTEYGFYLRNKDLYPYIPTYSISVDTSIADLITFAALNNVNYRILKEFNPWLRSDQLINKDRNTYLIDLPKAGYTSYLKLISEIENADAIPGAEPSEMPGQ